MMSLAFCASKALPSLGGTPLSLHARPHSTEEQLSMPCCRHVGILPSRVSEQLVQNYAIGVQHREANL